MQYDLQCKDVLTESFVLPHRFDGHMVDVKDYINEEMNAHLSSAPDSYDRQDNVILAPITQWTLRTTLDSAPDIDSDTEFQEGDTQLFKYKLVDGTSNYTVTANPITIPLSTDVVPYAFRNRVKEQPYNIQVNLSSLAVDRDVTNVFVTLYNQNPTENPNATKVETLFENSKYDVWVSIRIDHPANGELIFLLEATDKSLANLSLNPVDATEPLAPCTFTFVKDGELEQVNRIQIETKTVINNQSINMRLRTIKRSNNCHIVQKRLHDAVVIHSRPITISSSNNEHLPQSHRFARVGDTVSLTIQTNEAIESPTGTWFTGTTDVMGPWLQSDANNPSQWSTTLIITENMPQGPMSFTVNYTDLSGNAVLDNNSQSVISEADVDENVTIDTKEPVVVYYATIPSGVNHIQFDQDLRDSNAISIGDTHVPVTRSNDSTSIAFTTNNPDIPAQALVQDNSYNWNKTTWEKHSLPILLSSLSSLPQLPTDVFFNGTVVADTPFDIDGTCTMTEVTLEPEANFTFGGDTKLVLLASEYDISNTLTFNY
jgi:hypothetical protein